MQIDEMESGVVVLNLSEPPSRRNFDREWTQGKKNRSRHSVTFGMPCVNMVGFKT